MHRNIRSTIAHGARTPNTILALEQQRYREEQLDLEDFIESLNLGHIERIMP